MLNARIIGSGSAVPKQVVTNDDIAAMGLDTSDEWISSRTGIQQRCAKKQYSNIGLIIRRNELDAFFFFFG